jgi:hypothetical protein
VSEKQTTKEEKTEKSSEPTVEIEDLDATDEEDVKGGRPAGKDVIEINSWSF